MHVSVAYDTAMDLAAVGCCRLVEHFPGGLRQDARLDDNVLFPRLVTTRCTGGAQHLSHDGACCAPGRKILLLPYRLAIVGVVDQIPRCGVLHSNKGFQFGLSRQLASRSCKLAIHVIKQLRCQVCVRAPRYRYSYRSRIPGQVLLYS